MNTDSTANERQASDTVESDCMLYLLGELDVPTRRQFERRLDSDRKLGETLLRQADLLDMLAAMPIDPSSSEDQSSVSPASIEVTRNEHRPLNWKRHRKWIAAVASLAACLAWILHGVWLTSNRPVHSTSHLGEVTIATGHPDDAVLIAQAWAASYREVDLDSSEFSDFMLVIPSDVDGLNFDLNDPSGEIDSSLPWMLVAVASDSELQLEDNSDG